MVHDNIAPRLDSQGDKPENHFYDSNNNKGKPHYYNRVSRSNNTSHKNNDVASWPSFSGPFDSLSKELKIEQLRKLLNKYHFPQYVANEYLKFVSWMAIVGNDISYLDGMLAFLSANDTGEPCYKNTHDEPVTTGSHNSGGSYSRIFGYTAAQEYQNEGHRHIPPDVYSQGKTKLARIESLLLPYCPQHYVQSVIAELSKEFEATGNLSELNTALEYHLKNVEQHYAQRGFMKR